MRRRFAPCRCLLSLIGALAIGAVPTTFGVTAYAMAQAGTSQGSLIDPAALVADADAQQGDPELRDIKPLRPAKAVIWPYVALGVVLVALLAAGLWLWWRRRKNKRAEAQAARAILPPHEIALNALQALHRVNFADEKAVRQYYFAISEVLRAYVTARFELMASQLTTEEIFSRLPRLVELAPPENLRLRAFLAQTDQVKYALHQATPEEISATYEQAVAFIDATIPKPAPNAFDTQGAG